MLLLLVTMVDQVRATAHGGGNPMLQLQLHLQ
jgi:hypothetical protein